MARGTPALHSHCSGELQELKANYASQAGHGQQEKGKSQKYHH